MTLNDARRIGYDMFGWDKRFFDKCKAAAEEMQVHPQHMGPMCLAIGVMGFAKVGKENIEGELTDALSLVAKAEHVWQLKQKGRLQ